MYFTQDYIVPRKLTIDNHATGCLKESHLLMNMLRLEIDIAEECDSENVRISNGDEIICISLMKLQNPAHAA